MPLLLTGSLPVGQIEKEMYMPFKTTKRSIFLSALILVAFKSIGTAFSQTAWFADGYHGGIYGHYPLWQARFMVDHLTKNSDWAINLEIEPETWDSISVVDAKNFQDFQELVKREGVSGRVEFVNPTWSQPYCYNISGESIIRQFLYGMEKTREYFPNVPFQTYAVEEPCFTSSLPGILKSLGYKYAVLRNPNTCWGGYTSPFGKDLVNWIGPDGTSIVAVPRYGIEQLSDESTWQTESWTNSINFIENCFAAGIRYPVGMCFQDAGWDGGPWHNEYKPSKYTTWSGYFEMVDGKVKPEDWHFTQEDVRPGLVWGAQVVQKIAQRVRHGENLLITAEKIAAIDHLTSGTPWPKSDFDEAWRNLMLAQHHDCWIVPYNGKPGDTWADKVERWIMVVDRIASGKIGSSGSLSDHQVIRVFNTLGAPREELVSVNLPQRFEKHGVSVLDQNGKPVPAQLSVNDREERVLHFRVTVPAMGYRTYRLVGTDEALSANDLRSGVNMPLVITTPFYEAKIDPARGGALASLIDKKNGGRQLVEDGALLNDLRGFFFDEGRFHNGSDRMATVTVVDRGSLFTRVKVENRLAGHLYRQWITFYEHDPKIDFSLEIEWEGQPSIGAYDQRKSYKATSREKAFYNDAFKLHVRLPFKGDIGRTLYKNAPFDVTRSSHENTLFSSWDSLKHNVILNWVDITGEAGDYGVALFSDHTTSYLQSEELPLGLTVQYAGIGLWGRDYKVDGPTRLNYSILPHRGNWNDGMVEWNSSCWNEPLVARFIADDQDPSELSLFETGDRHLQVVSAIIQGDDLLVRLYNGSSKENPGMISWKGKARQVEQVELDGRLLKKVSTGSGKNGEFVTATPLPPFGLGTIRLTGFSQ